MINVTFDGANSELEPPDGAPDDCIPVPAFVGSDLNGHQCVVMGFRPSREDIQAINNGDTIYLKLLTTPRNIPITSLFTLNQNSQSNE